MGVWDWFMVNCMSLHIRSENRLSPEMPKQQVIELQEGEAKREIQAESPFLPIEMVMTIFDHLAGDHLKKPSLENEGLKTLFRAQVCKQWNLIADEYFSKTYILIMGGDKKPDDMSGGQALGLLYNWKRQTRSGILRTAKSISRAIIPIDCHQPIDFPATTYDKIEINGMRILLNAKYLVGFHVVDLKAPQLIWRQKVKNPERYIFVSTDQKLIATHHYYSIKDKKEIKRLACCFDVRHLRNGVLLGQIKIVCPQNKKIFNPTQVQFDLKKFIYLKEDKECTRHYDPCLVQKFRRIPGSQTSSD